MRKVCLLTRTTAVNDRQTLSEAEALGRAGLEVVVIGLLRGNLREHEHYENFEIHRIPPVGLMVGSRWRPMAKANSQLKCVCCCHQARVVTTGPENLSAHP